MYVLATGAETMDHNRIFAYQYSCWTIFTAETYDISSKTEIAYQDRIRNNPVVGGYKSGSDQSNYVRSFSFFIDVWNAYDATRSTINN